MIISDIYAQYDIMPTLALHQLRVAAVAHIICERSRVPLPRTHIISACLLHDMGNIIKFDLDHIPQGLAIGDVGHWKEVQRRYKETYGEDEHVATLAIARCCGVSQETLRILEGIGTSYAQHAYEGHDTAVLVATYSDFRVTPTAVVSLEERITDLLARYEHTEKYAPYKKTTEVYFSIEPYLMRALGLTSVALAASDIAHAIEAVRTWEIV